MRVTRITIDADLGLIELQTGPGGDGNYVLLPLEVSEALQRYVTMAGEPCTAEAPAEPILAPEPPAFPAFPVFPAFPAPAAHVGPKPLEGKEVFHITDACGYTVAKIDNDRDEYGSSPGSARWLPNPLPVYALEHTRGYRVSSPFIRNWFTDIPKYELHVLPSLALYAAAKLGKNTTNTDIAIIVKEMD